MNNKYKKDILEIIVKESTTWADVCRKVGIKPHTGAQCHLKKRCVEFELDFNHFLGQSHGKGKPLKKKDALEFCFKGSKENSHRLKQRLIRDGYKENKCELCRLSEWLGEQIPLELDHKDSDHSNNELDNLQVICPNCHSLETRKRKNADVGKFR